MACVHVSIENDTILGRFHQALTQAASVGSEMIEVKTKITNGSILKVVRTECHWAISVFRSLNVVEASHD